MAERRPPRRHGGTGNTGGPGSTGGAGKGPGKPTGKDGGKGPKGTGKGGPPREPGRHHDHAAHRPPRRTAQHPPVASAGRPPEKTVEKAAESAPQSGKGERIAKLLARAGVGSRRDIERMIAEGRIARDGEVIDTPATILTSLDGIRVDGKPVASADATRLFLFHKPAGVLTAARDPGGRPTIYDILPAGLPRLMPIGRLDLSTEGLLLLTNDGELKRALELPANAVPRTYRIRALGEVRQADLEALALGVTLEGVRYGSVDASVDRRARADGANIWLTMTLTEGKNREVRRLCEAMGLKVNRLIRTSYGPFQLGDSPARAIVEASSTAVRQLQAQLKRAVAKQPPKPKNP